MIAVPPRRTVDLQQPNSQRLTETHHFPSSFHLASQIPANTFKRVLDAVDGYHAMNGTDMCMIDCLRDF